MEKKRQIWTLLALSVSLLGLVSTQWVEPPPRYQVKIRQKLIHRKEFTLRNDQQLVPQEITY